MSKSICPLDLRRKPVRVLTSGKYDTGFDISMATAVVVRIGIAFSNREPRSKHWNIYP